MRLGVCRGCPNLIPFKAGVGKQREWCEECVARFRERDAQLDLGYGPLAPLRHTDGSLLRSEDVSFVLMMRSMLEAEHEACLAAVQVALREGARAVGESHQVPFGEEITELEEAADRAFSRLPPERQYKLWSDELAKT